MNDLIELLGVEDVMNILNGRAKITFCKNSTPLPIPVSNEFLISDFSWGQTNALVKKLEGEEQVREIIEGKIKLNIELKPFIIKEGGCIFTVKTDIQTKKMLTDIGINYIDKGYRIISHIFKTYENKQATLFVFDDNFGDVERESISKEIKNSGYDLGTNQDFFGFLFFEKNNIPENTTVVFLGSKHKNKYGKTVVLCYRQSGISRILFWGDVKYLYNNTCSFLGFKVPKK